MAIKVKLLVACALGLCLWVGWAGASPADESESEETTTSAEEAVYICPSCHCKIHGTKIHCPICSCPLTGVQPLSESEHLNTGDKSTTLKSERNPIALHRLSGRAQIGMMFNSEFTTLGTWLTSGYRVYPWMVIGLGTGYEVSPTSSSVPAFLEIRFDLSQKTTGFFCYLDGGYNFSHLKIPFYGHSDTSGGLVGYGIGIRILGESGYGILIDCGYRLEHARIPVAAYTRYGTIDNIHDHPRDFPNFLFGLGFLY